MEVGKKADKMFFRKMKLKQKTLLLVMLPMLIIATVFIIYQSNFVSRNFMEQKEINVEKAMNFIVHPISLALWTFDEDIIKLNAQSSIEHNDLKEMIITDAQGAIVYSVSWNGKDFQNEKKPQREGISKKMPLLHKEKHIGDIEVFYDYHSVQGIISKFNREQLFIWILVFVLFISSAYLSLNYFVIRPIQKLNGALLSISQSNGDISARLNVDTQDEVGEVAFNFNSFVSKMESIVLSIRKIAGAALQSSKEVYSGNNQLASSTQEMASSLEETASSVEEITASIKDAASLSGDIAAKMRKTTLEAEAGAKMLSQMAQSMKAVKESGDKIQDIVSVVNDIAFQTNLLALNAAVEAARAGENGKGFAVVAAEVRSLAARCASAATEIKELVEMNEENIRTTNDLSKKTVTTLMQVVNRIQEASGEVQDIEKRAQEQSSGIQQINSAILQMDEVTQRNASLVEELANSAEDMSTISNSLASEIGQFKVSSKIE